MLNTDWNSSENHVFINPRFSEQNKLKFLSWLKPALSESVAHLFLQSSGTTSQSIDDQKWVALSKEAFLASAEQVNLLLQSHSRDIWLNGLPEFHVGGLGIHVRAFLSGAQVVKAPQWDPYSYCNWAVETGATLSSLVPAQVFDLVNTGRKCPPTFRALLIGGGALSVSLYQEARKLGWPLLPTYGMTETCSQIATASLESLQSEGTDLPDLQLLPHLEVRVNREGRLEIKGKSLFSFYVTQSGIDEGKKDGWFSSQDRVHLYGNKIKILGRTQDFVKIGGENVELGRLRTQIEKARLALKINADVSVIAVPDERLGSVIHLISDLTLDSEQEKALLREYHLEVLGFEKIRQIHRFDRLPRNELGKLNPSKCLELIQRKELPRF